MLRLHFCCCFQQQTATISRRPASHLCRQGSPLHAGPCQRQHLLAAMTLSLLCDGCRPDRTSFAAAQFVEAELGSKYVEPPMLDLTEALADSSTGAPLIFVLSPGIDPTEPLLKLAASAHMSERCFSVALGQGQVRHCHFPCLAPGCLAAQPRKSYGWWKHMGCCSSQDACVGSTYHGDCLICLSSACG